MSIQQTPEEMLEVVEVEPKTDRIKEIHSILEITRKLDLILEKLSKRIKK